MIKVRDKLKITTGEARVNLENLQKEPGHFG
jgi:hypothetical protein